MIYVKMPDGKEWTFSLIDNKIESWPIQLNPDPTMGGLRPPLKPFPYHEALPLNLVLNWTKSK